MTVASQTTKVTTGAGNGSTTVFSFSPIVIFDTDELEVKLITLATAAETLLALGTGTTNYSVAATTTFPGTGSITYPATLGTQMASTHKLSIKRVLTLEQTLDLENQGGYLPENQEQAFDKGVMLDLQQQEEIDRSLKAPQGISSAFSFEIPEGLELAANAGFALLINEDCTGFTISTLTSTAASAFMTTVLDDATARGARATLISGVKGADVASTAGVMTLGADGDYFDITGTNSITGIATLGVGQEVTLHFDAAATLVHHATDLIMPGGVNVVCAAGDEFTFVEYASADWRCTSYALASGKAIVVRGAKGTDVASTAGVMTLGVGSYFDITGTNAITGIATLGIGKEVTLHFDSTATLVHHATNLILPSAANIICAAGDEFTFVEYASADWRCVSYSLASGQSIVDGPGVKGTDVASTAGVMTLGAGTYFDITGTNSITGIATKATTSVPVGAQVTLHFDAAAVLVHDATNFVLPGASNITCAAGDEFTFVEYASADWRCTSYALASGRAIAQTAALSGVTSIATGTTDGSDDSLLQIGGGGVVGVTRGGYINLNGNEHGSTGKIDLFAGNVSGGNIRFYTEATDLKLTIPEAGGITVATVAPATPAVKTLYEDSIVKMWCSHTAATTVADDVNVSSISTASTGQYSFTYATAMAAEYSGTTNPKGTQVSILATKATGSALCFVRNSSFALAAGSLNVTIVGNN